MTQRKHKVTISGVEKDRAETDAEQAAREELAEEFCADELTSLRLEIESLREQLEKKAAEAEESRSLYLRALADFNNYKKRHAETYDRHLQAANEDLILKLLPVVDNFERALAASREAHSFDSLAEGVELTLRQLQDLLAAEGVEAIPAEGQKFDPELHEAVMSAATDEVPDHTVLEELQRGYTYRSKVIRPAKVKVAVNP